MTIYRIIIVTLIAWANVSVALAQIYKCEGPDGPIYSDRECAPGAATVEITESNGLTGISDEEISELAEKKLDRDKARNRNNDGTVIEHQSTAELTAYNNALRVRKRDQLQRIKSGVSDNTPQQLPKKKGKRRN
jgi:hypothetical protein